MPNYPDDPEDPWWVRWDMHLCKLAEVFDERAALVAERRRAETNNNKAQGESNA